MKMKQTLKDLKIHKASIAYILAAIAWLMLGLDSLSWVIASFSLGIALAAWAFEKVNQICIQYESQIEKLLHDNCETMHMVRFALEAGRLKKKRIAELEAEIAKLAENKQ